jgi:hypothetical protein
MEQYVPPKPLRATFRTSKTEPSRIKYSRLLLLTLSIRLFNKIRESDRRCLFVTIVLEGQR